MRRFRALCAAVFGAAAAVAATLAAAQQWPARPILTVGPYSAGAATDVVGRIVLDQAGREIGEPFVIETRPGAGGVVGVASVVRAEPDGYTTLLSSSSMSSAVITHASLPYDAVRDLQGVAMFGVQPNVLVVAPGKGYKTVADLVAAAKAKPGALNFGSAGIGSASHISGTRFALAAGISVQHVPFKGPEALNELMAGRLDFYFVPLAPAIGLISQGKVAPLAVSTRERAPLLPDVPSIAEAGYPDAEYLFWGGLSVPAKTPPDIVDKLNAAVNKSLDDAQVKEKLFKIGVKAVPMTPAQYQKYFADDVVAMEKLAKDAHIEATE